MNQSCELKELYESQVDPFIIITCKKCWNTYVIYEAFWKWNEKVDNYKLIEMDETNYCPYCGSRGRKYRE